jgi:hydrogenase maturation protein HypF
VGPAPEPAAGDGEHVARRQLRVTGTVQGVGFRPFVYRHAVALGLHGFVRNDTTGVLIEVEGPASAIASLERLLVEEPPPLARVDRVRATDLDPLPRGPVIDAPAFVIAPSEAEGDADVPVSVDTAPCAACLSEVFDPDNRRFRYPFTNCTDCGPRYTLIRSVPYDRPATTMAGFTMCAACQREYDDPADRRFHAQPNACPACGPRLELRGLTDRSTDRVAAPVDPIRAAAAALNAGAVVAVKGIGGFHLACRADDAAAVRTLALRKRRPDRPFAVMVATLAQAAALAEIDDVASAALTDRARPIVLVPRRPGARVADAVAARSPDLGLMLAYSPLHHLLLGDVGRPLVMTSANVADEPTLYRDAEAIAALRGIADLMLTHDRPIQVRADDSIVHPVTLPGGRRTVTLRRSRGWVPNSLALPDAGSAAILACGAELKNTFCLSKGGRAWLSHHIGDLADAEALASFTDGVEHFQRLFDVAPAVIAHDLHPEYLSSKYARDRAEAAAGAPELIAVQHHHAHLAACLAEHGQTGPAVGAIFDGTGYGSDGTVWGGELLIGDLGGFRRVGALAAVPMPGGERAIREPWRMACAWLTHCGLGTIPPALAEGVDRRRWELVATMAVRGLQAPQTTSMGRLFDAVAALCGLRTVATYEGQAAIELEAACDPRAQGSYEFDLSHVGPGLCLDPAPALAALCDDLSRGVPVRTIATRFHRAVSSATVAACRSLAGCAETDQVVLAGGVFQNRRLLESVAAGLEDGGLRVLVPERLPAGDGGISFGQAAVAAWRSRPGSGPRGPTVVGGG